MLQSPVSLSAAHVLDGFDSGVASLDDWLRKRALPNQTSGASRTFVTCDAGRVVAYYALAACAIATGSAPGKFRRNMPDPIPVVVLGRLAIARSHQGQGLGRSMFQDAAKRIVQTADPSAFAACSFMRSPKMRRRSTCNSAWTLLRLSR